MAGVAPAGRATALGRHCRASRSAPRSSLASPRRAERGSRADGAAPDRARIPPHRQSARSTNAAPDGCPTPAGEVDMRLAGAPTFLFSRHFFPSAWGDPIMRGPGVVRELAGTRGGLARVCHASRSPPHRGPGHHRGPHLARSQHPPRWAWRWLSSHPATLRRPRELSDCRLMSSVKDNVGRGLNIALVNDVNDLLKFIRPLHEGTLVFVASYDDPATKMNEETRKLFSDLGSKNVKDLAFRDSWVFVGAKGVQNKSPFEQHVKNSKHTNKYEGWPEALEMEGCIPRRTTAS
ncbi:protein FAM3A isoform X3 [Balaenoptera ricei]|uniref:protein FAM3A isoform X3 n=1 Tax=Balaenoptera ricei TaxID=2746895 RepID=UPI0028BD6758|nr:protein FAM3A isoform X3 [Balaenoptera ricei]